jgi:hypothetical protein
MHFKDHEAASQKRHVVTAQTHSNRARIRETQITMIIHFYLRVRNDMQEITNKHEHDSYARKQIDEWLSRDLR